MLELRAAWMTSMYARHAIAAERNGLVEANQSCGSVVANNNRHPLQTLCGRDADWLFFFPTPFAIHG
ncbi:hypothetical protein BKM14_17240 [Pseudomonas syringae pv. syringae]|nr:hypothetical protein BKM14_17240 [Pseudomonas syringae pv. syringae]POD53678.1 hypothetical protein BKM15_10020 [Pseudomonas syringae pv. syringae]